MSAKAGYTSFKHFLVTTPSPESYVTHVCINRPKALNAFYEPMWLELGQIFSKLSHDSSVRAIVFFGAGDKAFTAGLDVKAASEGGLLAQNTKDDPARKAAAFRRHVAEFQDCVSTLENCEKPVICVIHGYAFGLAIDLASAVDTRVCTTDAKMCVKEVDIGIAADVGSLSRLPKVVGNFGWVKDVCLSARVFGAAEAERVGFVSYVEKSKAEALTKATQLAEVLATKSPVAVQGTKDILNHARDHTIADSLRYTGIWNAAATQTQDVKQALLSGIQKRTPTFEKL